MERTETLRDYYEFAGRKIPEDLLKYNGVPRHFNILKRKNCTVGLPFARRDYWKITLLNNKAQLKTKQETVIIDKPCIIVSQPKMAYSWKSFDEDHTSGFICLFTDEYLTYDLKLIFNRLLQVLKANRTSSLFLDQDTYDLMFFYFQQLFDAYHSDFEYREEMVQKWLQLIVYQIIWKQSTNSPFLVKQGSPNRVVNAFVNALESQFPIDSPHNPISLRSPSDFAQLLNVHVNHLNHCLKVQTGKSTTQLINERIVAEAISLLKYSDWNISEIAESLGFEYVQHFTLFFKKNTGVTPKQYRATQAGDI